MAKKVDISELYDLFQKRNECYFVCGDICQLIPINEISREAGDLAIIEAMKRMTEAAGENDMVFRIGGDEFAILTDSTDVSYAEQVADKIRAQNGTEFEYQDRQIPLTLYASVTKMDTNRVKYDQLFAHLQETIRENKK